MEVGFALQEVNSNAPPIRPAQRNTTTRHPHHATGPPFIILPKSSTNPTKVCKVVPNSCKPKNKTNPTTQSTTHPTANNSNVPVSTFCKTAISSTNLKFENKSCNPHIILRITRTLCQSCRNPRIRLLKETFARTRRLTTSSPQDEICVGL